MTALLCLLALTQTARPDLVVADFESTSYAPWTATGDAFGSGPAAGTLPNQMPVSGYAGERLVNSYAGGDGTEGTLTSPEFQLERKRINLLVGGGHHPGKIEVRLIVDGHPTHAATGHNSESLRPVSWDVAALEGRTARIEIVDHETGGWGHINVDHIVQSDTPPPPPVDDREGLLAMADASVAAAAERVKDDPSRPTYHILPAANWLNDPNGLLFHDGYHHVFFQHNPYGDEWGHMHWAHARSRDLVRWEHLPIALWPSKALGEDHVFSGSAITRTDGTPMLFYTSISDRRPPEQWAAVPDDSPDLTLWKKHPANPILTESIHGDTKVHEWRDPYVFRHDDATYMVCGGNLNASQGGQGAVLLYRAEDDTLTKWSYRGVVFIHPDADVKNLECPILFPLDGRFVLITSQGQPVDWFVGDFDPEKPSFTPTARGKVDFGQVYAPSVLVQGVDRPILFGWINGVPPGKGWRHCLTLPRQLSIGRLDGHLKQLPYFRLRELGDYGMPDRFLTRESIETRELLPPEWSGDALWLQLSLDLGKARSVGLDLLAAADGTGGVPIRFDGRTLDVAGTKAPVPLEPSEPLHLAIYLDHSILEVVTLRGEAAYIAGTDTEADGAAWITRVVDFDPARDRIVLHAEGGPSGPIDIRHATSMKPGWVAR